MATQAERRETTRASIVAAAQTLFAERGYDATSVSEILELAGVSRGAMYHHFATKTDVFAAVFLRTSSDAIRRAVADDHPDATPLETLVAGCLRWLDASTEESVARILLVDGPAVLGWERCRALEEATSLGVMRQAIAGAVDSGELKVPSVDVAARLVNAVLADAALGLVASPTKEHREAAGLTITAMIGGLSVFCDSVA